MINLGFLTEGKSCCCIHHTFLLGLPTGWSFNKAPTLFWLHQPTINHLLEFGFFLDSTNLGFFLREKLAAVLIIPSSWGSQLYGDLH
jgi:hypothetical protein